MKKILFTLCVFWFITGHAQENRLTVFFDDLRQCYVLTSDLLVDKIKLSKKHGKTFKQTKEIKIKSKFYRITIKDINNADRLTVVIGTFIALIDLKELI